MFERDRARHGFIYPLSRCEVCSNCLRLKILSEANINRALRRAHQSLVITSREPQQVFRKTQKIT